MNNRTTVRTVHTLLFMLATFLFGSGLRAQITYDNFLPKSDIKPGALLTVSDPDTTLTGSGVFVNRTQYVSLVYTTEAHTDVQNYTPWSYNVVVKIMNGADSTQYFTDTLDIRRNDSLPLYQTLNHYTLPWYSLRIRVVSVCGKTGVDSTCVTDPHLYPLLPEDIELQAAVIRTQINGFNAMLNIPTGPVVYNPGTGIDSCETRYNSRLNALRQEYDALASQRLTDYMGTQGINKSKMDNIESLVRTHTLAGINRLVDTLVQADTVYQHQCDSVPMDNETLALLQSVSHEAFMDHFYEPYFAWFNTLSKNLYSGTQTYAQIRSADSTGYIDYVFDGFDHWGSSRLERVWSLYPPSVAACVMGHYGDTAAHWSERALAIIHDMYLVRDSVLDNKNVEDSLYMLYQGAKLQISTQTDNDYRAAVNALNKEILTLCGYDGAHMGDCNGYYDALLSANKAYMAALVDSVADTVAASYGIPKDMLGQSNPAVTAAINTLLTEYNNTLYVLDGQWAACSGDSAQADTILQLLKTKSVTSNYLASQFLQSRQGNIVNQYASTSTLPTLAEWQTLTANLVSSYRGEGKTLVLDKQAAIHARWPGLDSCTNATYGAHKDAGENAVENLLAKIDSTLDTLDVYGTVSSYTYEIALAKWMVDFENDPAYQAAVAKNDSLVTEKNETCGSGSTPPSESYFACLARTEVDLRNLQHRRNQDMSQFNNFTQTFRGITQPGGWNHANGNFMPLLDPLLGEYAYRIDSLMIAVLSPCFTDSVQQQQFEDMGAYDPLWESFFFQENFVAPYQQVLAFPFSGSPLDELATLYDSLVAETDTLYMDYLRVRVEAKFLDNGIMATWPLDSTTLACIEDQKDVGKTQFLGMMGGFMAKKQAYLEAGAVGVTTDSVGYRESVMYYSFLEALMANYYRGKFNQIDQQRKLCSSVLQNTDVPDNGIPEPATPSIEAEVAACQSDVEHRFNQLAVDFEKTKKEIVKVAFLTEMNGGMNILPLQGNLLDSSGLFMHRSLDPVDSLWLACNTDPDVLNILGVMFDSDVMLSVLYNHPPAYATDATLLYVGGNTTQPDFSHVDELPGIDSLVYMALAEARADWMVNKIQEQPQNYGTADSCIIHHQTDSVTNAQYAVKYASFQSKLRAFLNSFQALYDSTLINDDTLELKLRWTMAAQLRETYLYLQQYVALEQEYQACEGLRSQLVVWKREPDPSWAPKKGIGTKFPVKPVGKFPLLPIQPNIIDLTTSTVTVVTEEGSCGTVKFLQWPPIQQAVEYDLEWAYIDDMVYLEGQKANEHADIAYLAFTLTEPTRVNVKQNKYPFPGEYPNGKLYFRVRGVARIIDAAHQSYYQPQFFPWIYNWTGYAVSNAGVNFNGSNPYNDSFENNLNWQWEASFAEEGKYKRVISYHDGLNRPRQVVTHLSTDNLSVIGETLYDHEGRAAVQVLPYPEPCQELSYRDSTRADSLGGSFDKRDFELTAGNARMATTYGASEYYSVQNPFMAVENPLMHTGSIPDAQKYPYTQTAFMLDNTGRPTRSGGVGGDHTLNGEHATRYYYANASETELRRLFGKNVGLASHYKKNAVMDANGQLSIAYVDQEGRSVATALAGLSPDNVMPLESNQPIAFTQNLTENNVHNPVEGEWNIHYAQLNEIPDNEYTFTYTYGLDRLFEGTTPPCLVCEFDLEIYVTDSDGKRLPLTAITDAGNSVADTNYFYKRLDATSYELTHPCSTTTLPKQVTFTVLLPEVNTYTIHKKLRWDKEAALTDLWAASQPEVNSYTASVQTSILNTYISQINYDECEQMFPGTGFENIPDDVIDHTDELATTSQCRSYLNQMIDQITPYQGPLPSPTDEHPDESTTIVNSGIYGNDNTFWTAVTSLIEDGISAPNNPEYIAPSSWNYLVTGTYNLTSLVNTIKGNPSQWTDELKQELAKAHPEYCWYKKCLEYARSVPYDFDMAQKTNLTNGRPYRNPLGQGGSVSPFTNSGAISYDPLKDNSEIEPVIADKASNTPNGSIWNAAQTIVTNNLSNSNLNTDELAWQTFRGGYLQAKSDAFYTETDGCTFLANTDIAVVVKPDLPDTEEEISNANQANQTAWENAAPCGDICQQNALAWTTQLFANCGETGTELQVGQYNTVKQQIQHKLYEYCITQCGEANPFGIITEQMFANAMAQGSGLLWEAVDLFNDNFTGVEGCTSIDPNTIGIDSTFTYAQEEYTEQCHQVGVALTTNYSILNFINKINTALDNMTGPTDNFTIAPWTTPGGAEISVNHPLQVSSGGFTYECLLINVNDCSQYVPRTLDGSLCDDCTVKFLYANPDRPNDYQYITSPKDIIQINPSVASSFVFESNGDVTIPATFVLHVSPWLRTGIVKFNIHGCCKDTICSILPNPWTVDVNTDDLVDSCEKQLLELAHQSAENAFDNWLETYVNDLWQEADCGISEDLRCTYTKSEYHYTLYYYDQAANLVQTVPPKGVHPLDVNNTVHFTALGHWPGSTPTNPSHDMESRYKFNSLEVAIESETPDGGLTLYTPDNKGRPEQSRNAEQRKRAAALGSPVDIFSYTSYDNLGRIVSVSEIWGGYLPPTGLPIYQTTSTKYDAPVEFGQLGWKSENTRSRVSSVQYYEDNNVLRHAIFYSYDIHGNVKSMLTQVPALKNFGQEFHRVDYYYDLVSGKVNEVHYQPKGIDRLYYRYRYDADNRLITAETSRDYVNWERDAKYFYYPHGPLKRVETGHRKVQGTDYFYTVHGWLKGVNSGALNETYDLGRDGDIALGSNPDAQVARDAFGFTLDYYNTDYKPVGGSSMHQVPDIEATGFQESIPEQGLYNGNIVRMATALRKPDETRLPVLGYGYMYDQLNRIRQNYAYLSSNLHSTNSWSGIMGSNAYMGQYTYDANGNITALKRYDGSAILRDDFSAYHYTTKNAYSSGQFYNYKGPQNRLDYIDDAVSSGTFPDDMDDQSAANYGYDEIGNLVKDGAEQIDKIEWTVYGKVKSVLRTSGSKKPDLYFYYNGSGQRYMKVVIPKNQSTGAPLGKHDWKATYYQHDAQGNILAIYDIKGGPGDCGYDMFLNEHVLYGSSRLGTSTYDKYHMGYTNKPLAYPATGGLYYCSYEPDDNPSPFEPIGGTGTGAIGGGTMESIKPHGPHRVPGTRVPITGVNLPWAGDDENVKPTKEGTFFVPGRKRYEFSNHLGNVLVTVSDMPLGVDVGSDGDVDYYMPDVKTTSDYEPFGAPLKERTFTEQASSTVTSAITVPVITDTFDSSYTLAAVQAYDKWYRGAATTASIESGSLRFKRVNTSAVSVGRGFVAVPGKPYSLTFKRWKQGTSNNTLQVFIYKVSASADVYTLNSLSLPVGEGSAATLTLTDFFTPADNGNYIFGVRCQGSDTSTIYIDDVVFTYADTVTQTVVPPLPDFLWTFDDQSLAEAYGSGLTATAVNGPQPVADRCANPDSAYRFDGTDDRMTAPDNAGLDFGNQNFTVSVWARKISHKTWGNAVVAKWNTGATPGSNEWALGMGDNANGLGTPAFHFESGTTTYKVSSSANIALGTWYHLVGMRDGDTLRIFLNGTQTGTLYIGGASLNNVGRKLSFCSVEGGIYTNADIDDPAIFRRALSPQEVAAIYTGSCQLYTAPQTTYNNGYRFAFNGQLKDDEVYGEGNAYDFGARIYDPRIGRWLSKDPLQRMYASLSSYQGFANNPILMVDPTGGVIINGHTDENPDEKKIADEAIKLLSEHNVELYSFLQTARATADGEIIYKNQNGELIYTNSNGSTFAGTTADLNALYEQSLDIKVTVTITDVDGNTTEKRDDMLERSQQGGSYILGKADPSAHLEGHTDGPSWQVGGIVKEVINKKEYYYSYTDDALSDEGKVYLTDANINTLTLKYLKVARVNEAGDLNYDFNVKLDDYIKDNSRDNFMYGYFLAHEGGHVMSELLKSLQAYYFKQKMGVNSTGHETGNPSGTDAIDAANKFKESYLNNKNK